MDYSPPPLFKQGASARARAIFFAILAIFLLVVDSRLKSLTLVRQIIGTVLYPVQMVAVVPSLTYKNISHYFVSLNDLEKENTHLKRLQTSNADVLQQTSQLQSENNHLRQLLNARERLPVKSVLAEIIYDARDPSTSKVIVDRGIKDGIALGQPVIDDLGVVGQVTRVFPLTAEVTLLTDKNQAIPVQILRNGLRSVAYGRGQSAYLDMRLTSNADIQNGDQLVTSGIDGIYPPGLAVAKVAQVESKAVTTLENILCIPAAGIDRNKQLLILQVSTDNLPRPDTEDVRAKKEKINRKVTRDTTPPQSDIKPVDQQSLAQTASKDAATLESNRVVSPKIDVSKTGASKSDAIRIEPAKVEPAKAETVKPANKETAK
ncbi:rod shape-determining protein MreC [Undibacterium jejuense]|uniref:Cell shape-determining protein MreC n=1 Tax=Undibacterium jejuense TaxID=1344949 RepID=A0A923HQ90_9BURK|nr:rod shape-determining protein MreC [Undibacterium jejuense]MBC3862733.1 rod shape-determining protein MreC [Undibacterium jejuense]